MHEQPTDTHERVYLHEIYKWEILLIIFAIILENATSLMLYFNACSGVIENIGCHERCDLIKKLTLLQMTMIEHRCLEIRMV